VINGTLTRPFLLMLMALATALGGCAPQLTSAAPAVPTRPQQKMTQTDFVLRVVNYSCQIPLCNEVGHRNANLGSPGVRQTINQMCWRHMQADAAFERAPMTTECFERATMSVGDPGLSAIWGQCKALNEGHAGFAASCFSSALSELVQQGADVPITAMIPGALTDAPVTAAAPPVTPQAPKEIAPSCAEWADVVRKCEPPEKVAEEVRMIARFPEATCVAQLPRFKQSRSACLARAGAAPVSDAPAPAAGRVFVSATVVDARLANGLLVTAVVAGTGPHRAGLRVGDVVTAVNGAPASVAGWSRAHADAGLGGTLRATIKHNGKTEELEWTIAKCDAASCACGADGLCTRPGDAPPRQSLALILAGNRVQDALEGPGRAAGLAAGDEILRINEIPVRDVQSILEIVGQLELGATATVSYARAGKEAKATVKLPAP
jgi:hypothetical protein